MSELDFFCYSLYVQNERNYESNWAFVIFKVRDSKILLFKPLYSIEKPSAGETITKQSDDRMEECVVCQQIRPM